MVASFDFTESRLIGEIYAQALQRAAIPVQRQLALGSRELVEPALGQGLVDVLPEYLGSALIAASGSQPVPRGVDLQRADQVRVALARQLAPVHFEVLDPSPAQDQNAVVVMRTKASKDGLRTVSDLVRQGPVTLGAPSECARREYCLLGLQRLYGLQVKRLLTFATEGQRASALEQHVVDAAVLFTTDGRLGSSEFTVLSDDLHLQPAENLVPLVSKRVADRYGHRLTDVLDAVSARLTNNVLRFLNWQTDVAGKAVGEVAAAWLARQDLAS